MFAVMSVFFTVLAALVAFLAVVTILVFTAAAAFLVFPIVTAALCRAGSIMIWHVVSSVCI